MNHSTKLHIITFAIICLILLAIFSCLAAGKSDGMTFESFDTGPSVGWDILMMAAMVAGILVFVGIAVFRKGIGK